MSVSPTYTLYDKNNETYIFRSLNPNDAIGIWFDSLSFLNPGLTQASRIPANFNSFTKIVEDTSPSHIWLAIVKQSDPSVHVGNVHIGAIDYFNRMTFFGRFIFEPYRGLGLGTSISKSVIHYCFNELNLRKVKAGNIGDNIAARKSNEKAGLKLDYVEKNTYFHAGKYHDSFVYSAINDSF